MKENEYPKTIYLNNWGYNIVHNKIQESLLREEYELSQLESSYHSWFGAWLYPKMEEEYKHAVDVQQKIVD